jgi:potassium uptake TrkH family protein
MSQVSSGKKLNPTQIVVISFASVVALGTIFLLLPISTVDGKYTSFVAALFTAVSAVCVTGLTVVDTVTHWSGFGKFAIMIMIQLGGLGIVAFATLLGLLISGRISMSNRMTALSESKIMGASSVPQLLKRIFLIYLGFEAVMATYLTLRLHFEYKESLSTAIGNGVFHSISAFNNAGFSLYPGNLTMFNSDVFILAPIGLAVIVGGLGFPVLIELHEKFWKLNIQPNGKRKAFSLHARITLWVTGILLTAGSLFIGLMEWSNEKTLGALGSFDRVINAIFASIMPRTAGFNAVDISAMDSATWLGTNFLMFIGGGSGSTAGGIKVTTIAVLFFIIYTEVRGETAVNVGRRRLPRSIQRQALTLVGLSVTIMSIATTVLMAATDFSLDQILFEVVSAFSTVGLTTGITEDLPGFGQILLAVLMFTGRLGPIIIASALALRISKRHFELPKERPLIG